MINRIGARAWTILYVAVTCALLPAPAEAHLVTTGLGPLYDGMSHVFVSPEDFVPILAMAMLAGLNGPRASRSALFCLTGAWFLGGMIGFAIGHPVSSVATTVSFLILGILSATDRQMSPRLVSAIAVAVGLLHGWLNGAAMAASQRDPIGLIGIAIATFVIVALVAALVVSLRAAWMRIVVRVAGSWVVAIGMLMLGWEIRGISMR